MHVRPDGDDVGRHVEAAVPDRTDRIVRVDVRHGREHVDPVHAVQDRLVGEIADRRRWCPPGRRPAASVCAMTSSRRVPTGSSTPTPSGSCRGSNPRRVDAQRRDPRRHRIAGNLADVWKAGCREQAGVVQEHGPGGRMPGDASDVHPGDPFDVDRVAECTPPRPAGWPARRGTGRARADGASGGASPVVRPACPTGGRPQPSAIAPAARATAQRTARARASTRLPLSTILRTGATFRPRAPDVHDSRPRPARP